MMEATQPAGYLALPATGHGRPVLVLHAWWGLNATIKAVCDRLAEAGFSAFAPDLYQGQVTDQIAEAERLSTWLATQHHPQSSAIVAAAAAFIQGRAGQAAGGLAVIGFSMGAFFALELSVMAPELVQTVILFYGSRPGAYNGAQAAYLGHFASDDPYEPPAEVQHLEEALQAAGRPVTFHHYDATSHWFFEPDRADAYHPAAAALAWERTIAFLHGG